MGATQSARLGGVPLHHINFNERPPEDPNDSDYDSEPDTIDGKKARRFKSIANEDKADYKEVTDTMFQRRLRALSRAQLRSVILNTMDSSMVTRVSVVDELVRQNDTASLYFNDDLYTRDPTTKFNKKKKNKQGAPNLLRGILVTGSGDKTVKVWDTSTFKVVQTYGNQKTPILCLKFFRNWLMTGSSDRVIRCWNLATGELAMEYNGHKGPVASLHWDGTLLISGSFDKTLRMWDIRTGKSVQEFRGHSGLVSSLAYSNGTLLSASHDKTIKVWDIGSGYCMQTLVGHDREILCMAWNEDAIVASGSEESVIFIWNLESGKPFMWLPGHTDWITCLKYHNSSKVLVSGSQDHTVRVWHAESYRCLFVLEGHTDTIWSLHVSGRYFVTGSKDCTVRVWGRGSGECLKVLRAHAKGIHTLMFSVIDERLDASAQEGNSDEEPGQAKVTFGAISDAPTRSSMAQKQPIAGQSGGVRKSAAAVLAAMRANEALRETIRQDEGSSKPAPVKKGESFWNTMSKVQSVKNTLQKGKQKVETDPEPEQPKAPGPKARRMNARSTRGGKAPAKAAPMESVDVPAPGSSKGSPIRSPSPKKRTEPVPTEF